MSPIIEFSHIVSIDPWPADGISFDLAATPAECRLLKERFDLVGLDSLHASGHVERVGMDLVLSGVLEAEAVQSCIVTLEPIATTVQAPFERRFRRAASHDDHAAPGGGVTASDEALEFEILEKDEIDVGGVVAEEFYLALDPYPRAADADLALGEPEDHVAAHGAESAESPFAKLRRH